MSIGPLASMGQSQSRWRRNQLTPSQLRGKVQDIKAKSLKKLILSGRLAPCYEGQDDDEAGKVRLASACLPPSECMNGSLLLTSVHVHRSLKSV